ncbi:diguanylate cyclase [Marinomonas sp. A79]|uniref:diguanylate cyclase n=1 Tax=Marinomonas vulgaris TaxID=2823372 RepID=A0ABS5HD14_9GAMM|nr:sensor domain-containing diguanylate cyclase [Marinomonas vulgaris]MBR7889535.1 diguanylate cyclase [Marinomonas vulgaris]
MKAVPLRWLIVTPFVVLALLAGAAMYFFSTITMSNIATTVGTQYIKEVEGRIYDRVNNFLEPLNTIININQARFSQQPEVLNDLTPLAVRFYEQARLYPQMTFISVATADGRYLASSQDPINRGKHNMAANYANEPLTMEGFYYDPLRGLGEKITTDPTFGYDPRIRPFYTDALTEKDTAWSTITPYYGYPTLGVGLSVPIYDQNGEVLAVTATSMALVELDNFLKSLELIDDAYVFIAEEDGALIATSQTEALFEKTPTATTRARLEYSDNEVLRSASQDLTTSTQELTVNDDDYLYYIHPIALPHNKTWLIGILIPAAHHESLLAAYTKSTISVTLVLFLCIGFIGSLIAHYIGKPIQQLNRAANHEKLSSIQNLPQPLSSISEINSLSQGLISMADTLSDILHHLEQKVMDRTEHLQDENDTLLETTLTDELTGLLNRRGLNAALNSAIDDYHNKAQDFVFVICDIDHFKAINDEYGHTTGDEALAAVSHCLKSTRFGADIVARYGGDEFVLVFVNVDANDVIEKIQRVRQECERAATMALPVTMSFGLVKASSIDTVTMESIIQHADIKLYQSKNSGRNTITW